MKPHKFIILAGLLLLPACGANFSSISRNHDFNRGTSNIIDAKQRAIISVKKGETKNSPKKHIICAEPSPDALTALASSGAIEGSDGKIGAKLAGAFKESAGSIGLRTQTIQMLRDDKYRLCEAYANGAIDEIEYGFLLRQAQRNMLALLATEQLTGAISAPAITLSGGANSVEATQENIDNIDAEIRSLKEKNTRLDSKNSEEDKVIQENKEKIIRKEETRKAYLDSIRNGTAGSELNKIAGTQNISLKDMADVAKSVECIVNTLNTKGDNVSFCMMEYQRAVRDDKPMNTELQALCTKAVEKALENNNVKDASCGLSPTASASSSPSAKNASFISSNPLNPLGV